LNLAIDLDGTLAEWGSDHARCGEWIPGAQDALRQLREQGHKIVVHTCRATWDAGGGIAEVARFLQSGGFVACAVSMALDEHGNQQEDWRLIDDAGRVTNQDFLPATFEAKGIDAPPYPLKVPLQQVPEAIGIWSGQGKPIVHYYVDDRAITFRDNWETTLALIFATEIGSG
jgi:hypothetical protein